MHKLARRMVLASLALAFTAVGLAGERVGVRGSAVEYEARITATIDNQPVPMVLTGAALRKKLFFSVYTIASYVQDKVPVRTPEDLLAANCPKILHLVMERDVEGREIAVSFHGAIRDSHPAPAFDSELAALTEMLQSQPVKRGDQVYLTHVPKVGFYCELVKKKKVLIQSPEFSKAVWEIFLGKNSPASGLRFPLTSRVARSLP